MEDIENLKNKFLKQDWVKTSQSGIANILHTLVIALPKIKMPQMSHFHVI